MQHATSAAKCCKFIIGLIVVVIVVVAVAVIAKNGTNNDIIWRSQTQKTIQNDNFELIQSRRRHRMQIAASS